MWPYPQIPADLASFTEEIPNGKFHFFCSIQNFMIIFHPVCLGSVYTISILDWGARVFAWAIKTFEYILIDCEIFSEIFNGPQNLFIFPTFVYKNIKHKIHSLLNISYLSSALDNTCENMDFLWPILSRIRTESKILSLFGKIGFR